MAIAVGNNGEVAVVLKVQDDGSVVLERFGDKAEREGERAGGAWGKYGKMAAGAAVAMATAAAAMVMHSAKVADEAVKTADRLGMTVEQLTALRYAAELGGVGTEQLNVALRSMVKNLTDAANGTGEAQGALKALNLDAKTLAEMGPEAAVLAIADAMDGLENKGQATAMSMRIFGEAGAGMVNVMKGGAPAIRAAMEEAREFGQVISEEAARDAERFNDNLTRLTKSISGAGNVMAAELMGPLADVTGALIESAKKAQLFEGAAAVLSVTLKGVVSVGIGVATVLGKVGTTIGAVAAAATEVAQGNFGSAKAIMVSLNSDLAEMDREALERVANLWKAKEAADAVAGEPRGSGTIVVREDTDAAAKEAEKRRQELEQRLEDLRLSLLNEQQLLAEKYATDQATLQEALAEKLLTEDAYEQQRAALAEQYAAVRMEKSRAETEQYHADLMQKLAAFDEAKLGELERVEAWHLEQEMLLEELRQESLLNEQSYDERKLHLETEYQKRRTQIEDDALKQRYGLNAVYRSLDLSGAQAWMGHMAALMQSGNRQMFEAGKAAAITETVIQTYKAAQGAYAAFAHIPIVGPAMGAAAAVAATVAGMARVQAIKSQQFGSRSGGGTIPGGATPTVPVSPDTGVPLPAQPEAVTAAKQQTPRSVYVSIADDGGMVSTSWIRDRLFPMLNEAAGDGVEFVIARG
jgi:ATPase involved in DNA repair